MNRQLLRSITASLLLLASQSSAEVVFTFYQDGPDVVAIASGEYQLPSATFLYNDNTTSGYSDFDPEDPLRMLKLDDVYDLHDSYFDPPGNWPRDSILTAPPDSRTGDYFGFWGPFLMVPATSTPGTTLTPQTTYTWLSITLNDLGVGSLTATPTQIWSAGNWSDTISFALGSGPPPDPGGDPGETPGTARHISGNSSTSEEISFSVYDPDPDYDYYRIEVTSGGTLTAESSGDTDTYGILFDNNESWLVDDDDSGPGANFSFITYLDPGTYYIVVTGYNSGPYSLNCTFTGETTSPGSVIPPGPPVLLGVNGFAPDPVDVTAGAATMTVTLEIGDGDDGFSYGNLFLRNASGSHISTYFFGDGNRSSGTSMSGTYSIPVTIPAFAPPGTWEIEVWLVDQGGLEHWYAPGFYDPFPHPGEETFTVLNSGTIDVTPPAVNSFSISPGTIDTSSAPADITVNLNATDDLSEFKEISLYVYDPSGTFKSSAYVAGGVPGGDFSKTITMPQGSVEGTWRIRLVMTDAVGNYRSYGIVGDSFPIPGQEEFTVGAVTSSPFDQAAAIAGLTDDDALPGATPYHDGVTNLLKFAFGLNLGGPDARRMTSGGTVGLPTAYLQESGGTVWRVEFLRRKNSGLTYTPKKSTTLDNGSFTPLTGTPVVSSIDAEWDRVTVDEPFNPATTPKLFTTVEVTGE